MGRLNPRLRLRLTPLSSTAPMAITTPVFTLDFTTPTSMAPTTDPMVDITILARDLLKLSLAEATADPEADPYLLYGYGYPHAYGYAGLHHPYAYSAYHYRPYGYAYWG